jgi:hypothetical protein
MKRRPSEKAREGDNPGSLAPIGLAPMERKLVIPLAPILARLKTAKGTGGTWSATSPRCLIASPPGLLSARSRAGGRLKPRQRRWIIAPGVSQG